MSNIQISVTAAIRLMREAANLFNQGTGMYLDPDTDMPQQDALIDRINVNEDPDLMYWAHQLMNFARTIHGIIYNALEDEQENIRNN
jgi:hypothetical protein